MGETSFQYRVYWWSINLHIFVHYFNLTYSKNKTWDSTMMNVYHVTLLYVKTICNILTISSVSPNPLFKRPHCLSSGNLQLISYNYSGDDGFMARISCFTHADLVQTGKRQHCWIAVAWQFSPSAFRPSQRENSLIRYVFYFRYLSLKKWLKFTTIIIT